MTLIRFETASAVFEAFPVLGRLIPSRRAMQTPPQDPIAFLEGLAAGAAPHEALVFGAHILPRREAIGWLCMAFAPDDPAITLVRRWVEKPDETLRNAALDRATGADMSDPVTWALLAVGWSGGNIQRDPALPPLPAAPDLTAQAVGAGMTLALACVPLENRHATITAQVEACIRIATSGT